MKKIILTEKQERLLIGSVINEVKQYPVQPEKVLLIKKFLDKNFKRANMSQMGGDGMPEITPIVGMVDNTGNIVQNLSSHQLFDLLTNKFYKISADPIYRSKLIVRVIKDWYANKISDEGLLGTNVI